MGVTTRLATGITAVLAYGLIASEVALAGSDTAPPTTAPPTTAVVVEADPPSLLNRNQAFDASIWALGFGLAAIVAVLLFLYLDRRRSFRILNTSLQAGVPTDSQSEAAISRRDAADEPNDVPTGQILGLDVLDVGTEALYQVKDGAAEITWEASGDATLKNNSGARVHLTATGPGVIVLTAKLPPEVMTKSIEVRTRSGKPIGEIPFLGIGYGSVIIALAIASVTAALGLTDVLQGQAVATILGSLVTYTVARGVQGSRDNAPEQQ